MTPGMISSPLALFHLLIKPLQGDINLGFNDFGLSPK